jgi:protoporphyrinogen oxidase
MSQHWGIVGGGILGLSLAQRLQQAGHRVTVLEGAPQLGGLASAWQLGDITWDKFYHVILLSDSKVQELLKQLNLADQFVGVETKTGFYTDGQLYSMSNSWEFLKFPPLGLLNKLRLGFTIFYASKIKDWKALEHINVVDWLTKLSGRRTVEKIWLPLLRSKLGESYKVASAAFIWSIIARMYAARRSGLKKEMFGYVRGGYAKILEAFATQLQSQNVELLLNTKVRSVQQDGPAVRVQLHDDTALSFDNVVVTAAAPQASQLIPGLAEAEHQRLQNIQYQGIVCASVLMKNPLNKFYVTNITESWVPFTAVIEMSALVDRAELGGNCLTYLPKYVAPDDPIFEESDSSIQDRFLTALEKMYPHFQRSDVLSFQLARVRNVFAVSTLGYSGIVPPFDTSLPGIFLVNSSQIVNGTLNVNETLQLAEQALPTLLRQSKLSPELAATRG